MLKRQLERLLCTGYNFGINLSHMFCLEEDFTANL